jgi:hypothetical protein
MRDCWQFHLLNEFMLRILEMFIELDSLSAILQHFFYFFFSFGSIRRWEKKINYSESWCDAIVCTHRELEWKIQTRMKGEWTESGAKLFSSPRTHTHNRVAFLCVQVSLFKHLMAKKCKVNEKYHLHNLTSLSIHSTSIRAEKLCMNVCGWFNELAQWFSSTLCSAHLTFFFYIFRM